MSDVVTLHKVRIQPETGVAVMAVEHGWSDLFLMREALALLAKERRKACPPDIERPKNVLDDLIERTDAAFDIINAAT